MKPTTIWRAHDLVSQRLHAAQMKQKVLSSPKYKDFRELIHATEEDIAHYERQKALFANRLIRLLSDIEFNQLVADARKANIVRMRARR